MVALSRRMLLAGASVLTAALAGRSEACSLVANLRPIAFSDAACRRSLRELVGLIDQAPSLSDAELSARAGRLSVRLDESVSNAILNYPAQRPAEDIDVIRGWSSWAGKRDRSPLVVREINLLKGERGTALYQFTLRRDQYHPEVTEEEAASDSCGVVRDAFYGPEDASYLGLFVNNMLREVSAFDVWLRKS